MSHLFCQSCGTKIPYANAKPNFCSKCGQPLNASATASTNTAQGMQTLEQSVVISQDETDASSVPSIGKLEIEYDTTDHHSFTLGSLMGQESKSQPKGGERRSRPIDEFIDEKKAE